MLEGLPDLLQYYKLGGGVFRDPQIVLRNIWTAPYRHHKAKYSGNWKRNLNENLCAHENITTSQKHKSKPIKGWSPRLQNKCWMFGLCFSLFDIWHTSQRTKPGVPQRLNINFLTSNDCFGFAPSLASCWALSPFFGNYFYFLLLGLIPGVSDGQLDPLLSPAP